MKTYKQILVVFALGIFILPQIALASWWNPISWNIWKIFSKQGSETQILENRVRELEDKLDKVATSTTTTSTNSQEKAKTVSPAPAVKTVKTVPVEENFSAVLVGTYSNQVELLNKLIDVVDEMTLYIDSNLDDMTRLRNSARAYSEGAKSAGKDTTILDIFVDLYTNDIDSMNIYKNYFIGSKDNIEKNGVVYYRNLSNTTSRVFISKEKAILELHKITNDNSWQQISGAINKKFEEYKTYRKDSDNDYAEMEARIAGLASGYQSSVSTYTPLPPAPIIKIPTVRNTYCNVYGNTISCDSYSW